MKIVVLASLILAGLWHLPLAAQVYKWVDEKGNVHFSDRPQSEDSEQLNLDTTAEEESGVAANAEQVTTNSGNTGDNTAVAQAEPLNPNLPAEKLAVPPPLANCNATAENARRILLSQTDKPELRNVAVDSGFKSRFIQACRQSASSPEGRAQAVCIQRAKNLSEYESCSN